MTQHTPGPWFYENGKFAHVVYAPGGIATIATVYDGVTSEDGAMAPEAGPANARLIAAAPDLLAACEALLPELIPPYSPKTAEAIQRGYAAIAKAKGA